MSREAFERVMGPVEQVLSQQIAQYAASNAQQQAIKLEPDHGVGQLLPAGGSIPAPEATDGVVGGAPGGTPRPSHSGTAAAQASAVAEPALPLEPGLHAAASGGGVAALLPGSPRPSLLSADSPTGGRRRSTRGAHSSHSSEGEGSSGGGSPSAASALQQRHSGGLVVGTGAALGADAGVAAITATADCASSSTAALLQEQPSAEAVIHLPTIAEEPTEAAPAASPRPRTGGKAVHAARPARAPAGRALPSTATRKPGPGKVSVAARPSGGGAAGGSRASGTKAAPRKSKA